MITLFDWRLRKSDWPLILTSIAVLSVYLFYTVSYGFRAPYPGITLTAATNGWRIVDSFQPGLNVDDVLIQIGDLTFADYQVNRLSVPFGNYEPGDAVPVLRQSDGLVLYLTLAEPGLPERLRRLLFPTVSFFPFWLAGTAVLLLLWPRDLRWRLLVAFMYLTAIWALIGDISNLRIAGARIVLGISTWLLVPAVLHFHLIVPTPLAERVVRRLLLPLYIVCIALAVLELFQLPPSNLPLAGLALAILISFGVLLYRFFGHSSTPFEKLATRLMLAGIGLAFGPGIAIILLPQLFGTSLPGTLGLSVSLIAIPVLPLFYIYAIYKRQLGHLEFRANRLLSLYGFILLYPPIFLLIFLLGEQSIDTPGGRTIFSLALSIAFVLATPPLLARFERLVNRLAYGTRHNPDDIVRVFANQIPSALKRDALVRLLTQEIIPSLLIRQSALYLYEAGRPVLLYERGLEGEDEPLTDFQLEHLLNGAGHYRPPTSAAPAAANWVRLAIPIHFRHRTIGLWLFGRRDPDDFYPRNDIELLQVLANQIASVTENIHLYETLQRHADTLAETVAERTAELRAERDRTQAILDSAGEGIFFTDNRGQILYLNPAMIAITGYSNEETNGQTVGLWQTEAGEEANRKLWAAVQNGTGWSGEMIQHRRDGTLYDVSLTLAPIQLDSGQVTGFVGVVSDISKMKEVDRLKTNIIANVSHELKTPLTNINMYLALLRRGKSEKWTEYINVLEHESRRLTRLIQNLLDLSQLDAGIIFTRLEPTNVEAVLQDVVATYLTRATNKRVMLQVEEPSSRLPAAMADMAQLEQVITNLLGNALNYTPTGGRVTVHAGEGLLEERPAVWVRVSDTGPGITPEELPHLFERFFRGRASLESVAPGTGLGLAICKEIIERHQGRIEVESQPGRGATFTVWLKAAGELDGAPAARF